MNKHSELEFKFSAENVSIDQFRAWCLGLNPIGYRSKAFPDVYYRNGDAVARHRQFPGPGELTTKRRKSDDSIVDRMEINLRFGQGTTQDDVTQFLLTTGWKPEFTLQKHFSHVFWFKHGAADVSVSLYEVERQDTKVTRRFLEVEIDHSDVSDETAERLLATWGGCAANEFDLDEPMTESLYEIYSGRRYASVA